MLAHSVRVAQIARLFPGAYPDGLAHDESLTIATALLHDVGKTQTLPALAGGALPQEASHFDHVTIGVLMVRAAAERTEPRLPPERLEALLHAILARHGRNEWGAPCKPASVEARLVHLADLAESQLWDWSDEDG
jgi:3'-5' exoribonuclease